MPISDIMDFKTGSITGGKEGHFILIKGSILQGNTTILNNYAPNNYTQTS